MRFTYRILIHSETTQDVAEIQSNSKTNQDKSSVSTKQRRKKSTSLTDDQANANHKSVRFTDDKLSFSTKLDNSLPPPMTYTVFKSKAQEYRLGAHNNNNNKVNVNNSIEKEFDEQMLNDGNGPVKVIIARKPAAATSESKKSSPKRSHSVEEATYTVTTNDFKSLRSNDIRYSDYTVTSTTNSHSVSKNKQKQVKSSNQDKSKLTQNPKCDIVVSIPQSQIARSANSAEESVSFAQLKTANKKSPPQSTHSSSITSKTKNVPKLKIELGSLKTKITIPKPKSAGVCSGEPEHKKSKHRKFSVDECGPTADKVDLETYVKNIGLKPIEVIAPTEAAEPVEKGKYSPDASPMSSSSSTTSSSNGNFVFSSSTEISSSSHKKRKKKHSRESKDSNGKRRKLHAEISSQPADESLKMKVKITASHNHKPHKVESRKSSLSNEEVVNKPTQEKLVDNGKSKPQPEIEMNNAKNTEGNQCQNNNNKIGVNISTLNKTLSEESSNINNLMTGHNTSFSNEMPKIMTTVHSNVSSLSTPIEHLTLSPKPLLPKPLSNIKDVKIPSSPPLPPSLFKTTPLTLTTSTASTSSIPVKISPNPVTIYPSTKPVQKVTAKPASPVQPQGTSLLKQSTLAKSPNFVVPNPPRSMPSSAKLSSLPTSIASSANKHLKRSASVDDAFQQNQLSKHQPEKSMRKTAYGAPVGTTNSMRTMSAGQKESNTTKSGSEKSSFYSPISTAYTHEVNKRKILPMNLPPSSISVSKINDAYSIYSNPRISTQPALTITTHPKQTAAQQMINFLPYPPLNKPALEIVRITSNQVPADKLPLPPISPPKSVRSLQPPIPLLKIKKPGQQNASSPPQPATSTRSPPAPNKTLSPNQASPPALINMRNTIPLSVATKAAAVAAATKERSSNSDEIKQGNGSATTTALDKPKASLRDFRPTSKDGSVEILDLSASKSHDMPKATPVAAPTTPSGNSLEAALNKIKQNMTSNTVSDSLQSSKLSAAKTNQSEDLQNLHMLSESATSREKIAIKPQQKLYEMSKVPQAPMVRQQNASVRNIPNPSALAFRNQPSLSLLASIASPPSPQTNVNQPASPSAANDAKTLSPPTSMFTSSPKSPNVQTTNQTSPRAKKLTSIDQVAATLNIRAAAAEAEASAAKASAATGHNEESSLVSSTSATESKTGIKINTTETTSANLVTSTVSSSTSTLKPAIISAENQSSSQPTQSVSTTAGTTIPTPSVPKTSFKSISSLVATTSSAPNAVAGSV